MAERLHLVMPSIRAENIGRIAMFYAREMEPHPFEVRWHILFQGPESDPKGVKKTNEGIDGIKDGWVIGVGDDTVHHPSLFRRIGEISDANPGIGAIVFSENRGNGYILRASPHTVQPGLICGGQVVWRRWLLGDHRLDWDRFQERADGNLIQHIYTLNPGAFFFTDEPIMYFDSLLW